MRKGGFRGLMTVVLALAATYPAAADQVLYRSNGSGMLLDPIPSFRRDEYAYVIEVEKKDGSEVRRLFDGGKEIKRWEIVFAENGVKREERELDAGVISARRVYGKTGDILVEETYADGELSQKAEYVYSGDRLVGVRVNAADGSPLSSQRYVLSTKGTLREVLKENADGSSSSSSIVAGGSGVGEERDRIGDITYVTRFDAKGRTVAKEQRKGGELVVREDFTFRPGSDHLISSTERHPRDTSLIERSYDEEGRLSSETLTVSGKFSEQTGYTWDGDGHITVKRRRSGAGIEEWRFTYDGNGEVAQEDYYRRGSHEKTVVYTAKDERFEELFREGELVLRVHYKGEKKTKEEVYSSGRLVRERSFE